MLDQGRKPSTDAAVSYRPDVVRAVATAPKSSLFTPGTFALGITLQLAHPSATITLEVPAALRQAANTTRPTLSESES